MIRLGINIDHIATLRNARGENHPDILKAAKYVMKNGADLITIHLREDRRHIKDLDLKQLSKIKSIPINLEMAANFNMLKQALRFQPNFVCIVPEKRKEITTEGGLNIKKNIKNLKKIVTTLNKKKIRTSLFIDPKIKDITTGHLIRSLNYLYHVILIVCVVQDFLDVFSISLMQSGRSDYLFRLF